MPAIAVRTAEPLLYVDQRLTAGNDFFIENLKRRNFLRGEEWAQKNAIPVIIGEKTRIPNDAVPCLRIVPVNFSPEWGAARIRFEKYQFFIDVMVKTSQSQVVDEFVMTFALLTLNWLLDFNQLQAKIPEVNQKSYDSWIDSCEFGYTKGQVWRVARLTYWLKMQYTYVGTKGGDPC
jgi:hypothetical protein